MLSILSIPTLITLAIVVMIVACILLSMIGYTLDKILDLLREWYRGWTNK
jgi:uncharacterized membrane protein